MFDPTLIIVSMIGAGGTVVSAVLLRGQSKIHGLVNGTLGEITRQRNVFSDEIKQLRLMVIALGGKDELPHTETARELDA